MVVVGYLGGLSRSRQSPAIVVLARTFSAILLLIADLDRPRAGLLEGSQQTMKDVRYMMDEDRAAPVSTDRNP